MELGQCMVIGIEIYSLKHGTNMSQDLSIFFFFFLLYQ